MFGGEGWGHVGFQWVGVHVEFVGDEDLDDIACCLRGGTKVTRAIGPSHLEHTWDDEAERLTWELRKHVGKVPTVGCGNSHAPEAVGEVNLAEHDHFFGRDGCREVESAW